MHCPFCNAADSKVIDSRLAAEGCQIRRRRECISCGERFTTFETYEVVMPRVIKSDGKSEPFDEAKMRRSLMHALQKRPVTQEQIETVLSDIQLQIRRLGVLFLDELPEFDRKVLEVLRQPLESKEIVISRASRQMTFPANFQLIAAMNPCPCGYAFNQDVRCQCSADAIKRYQNRISGPLLDRIDLHLDVPPLQATELQDTTPVENSQTVRERVIQAYQRQIQRQNCLNHALSPKQLEQYVVLDPQAQKIIEMAQQRLNLSARAYHRVLRVARSIADLSEHSEIQTQHLTEALSYRAQQN